MKVKEFNNWQVINYKNENDEIVKFYNNQELTIRYPNGLKEVVRLKEKKTSAYYMDCGSRYDVEQIRFGFLTQFNSLDIFIDITQVEILNKEEEE